MRVGISKDWTFGVNNVLYKANRDLVLEEIPHPKHARLVPSIRLDGGTTNMSARSAVATGVITPTQTGEY